MPQPTLFLGEIWQARADQSFSIEARGALLVAAGKIVDCGPAAALMPKHTGAQIIDCGNAIIAPGFVDAHVHFPQIDMIGSHGSQLLEWLRQYTYPAEMRYADQGHATDAATRFVTELLANGTTAAAIYGSSHACSAEALFEECDKRGMRAVIGKVSMDRDAPPALTVPLSQDLRETEDLIARWHGRDGRLFYALTPRFALACSDELMAGLGALLHKHKDIYVQTHHAETRAELAAVARRFPKAAHYLDVYRGFHLLSERTILGHSVYATDDERHLLAKTRCVIAHCPTSNMFLGSGLFPLKAHSADGVRLALGTDVGAGTSFSLWKTMRTAYEVQQLQSQTVKAETLFWLATRGGAEALGMAAVTGCFDAGSDADFQVLSWSKDRLLAKRLGDPALAPADRLFAMITLADDRIVDRVYIRGRNVYQR